MTDLNTMTEGELVEPQDDTDCIKTYYLDRTRVYLDLAERHYGDTASNAAKRTGLATAYALGALTLSMAEVIENQKTALSHFDRLIDAADGGQS